MCLLLLEGEDLVSIVLAATFVETSVELREMVGVVVGVFAPVIVVMDVEIESRTIAGACVFEHLQTLSELPDAAIGRRPMC